MSGLTPVYYKDLISNLTINYLIRNDFFISFVAENNMAYIDGQQYHNFGESISNLTSSDIIKLENCPNETNFRSPQCMKNYVNRTSKTCNNEILNKNTSEYVNKTNVHSVNSSYSADNCQPGNEHLLFRSENQYLENLSSINARLENISDEITLEQNTQTRNHPANTEFADRYGVGNNDIETTKDFSNNYDSHDKVNCRLIQNLSNANVTQTISNVNHSIEEVPEILNHQAIAQSEHHNLCIHKEDSTSKCDKNSFSVNEILKAQGLNHFPSHKTAGYTKEKEIILSKNILPNSTKQKPHSKRNSKPIKPKEYVGTRTRCRRKARILFTQVTKLCNSLMAGFINCLSQVAEGD